MKNDFSNLVKADNMIIKNSPKKLDRNINGNFSVKNYCDETLTIIISVRKKNGDPAILGEQFGIESIGNIDCTIV